MITSQPLEVFVPRPESWTELALCAEVGDDFWFPEKGGSTAAAKRVCRSCVVRAECLEYALEHDERFGIWGGMSERERRRLKRGADKAAIAAADAAQDAAAATAARQAAVLARVNSARLAEAARPARAARRAALGLPEPSVPQPRKAVA